MDVFDHWSCFNSPAPAKKSFPQTDKQKIPFSHAFQSNQLRIYFDSLSFKFLGRKTKNGPKSQL